ncbi:hypothetical protein D3C81_1901750 [compost metagenome]
MQVAPLCARGSATGLPQHTVQRNQVDHRRARGQVDHAQVLTHPADRAAEHIHIKGDAARQVTDPQHKVVDALDGERSHVGVPCSGCAR